MRFLDWVNYLSFCSYHCEGCIYSCACQYPKHIGAESYSAIIDLKTEEDVVRYVTKIKLGGPKYSWSMACSGQGLYARKRGSTTNQEETARVQEINSKILTKRICADAIAMRDNGEDISWLPKRYLKMIEGKTLDDFRDDGYYD